MKASLLLIVALLLGSGLGCAVTVIDEPEIHVAHPGREAAWICKAWAAGIQDDLRLYEREQADLEQRRNALLRDAFAYREKSAAVWSDPGIPEYQRSSTASQYSHMAVLAEAEVDRVHERIDSYASEIGVLEYQRQNWLLKAVKFESAGSLR